MNISAEKTQLTLNFAPGLTETHRNLRDCVATSIYKRGLSTCAIDLNESPGNLSNQLSDDSPRKFGIDDLETYLQKSKDYTPIYYLVEKFLNDKSMEREAAGNEALQAIASLMPLLKKAGLVA
ncbi:hypothetical protein [Candidimonas nitroreducens]|uniref:hypothetical protein n=1 Tax=Candidimonas nitroreducens TaxID=683354 RepID=UPI001E571D06|nr:hypothetical protein [Candidimonas nitroreducens]